MTPHVCIHREALCNFERGRNGITARNYVRYRAVLDSELLRLAKGKEGR